MERKEWKGRREREGVSGQECKERLGRERIGKQEVERTEWKGIVEGKEWKGRAGVKRKGWSERIEKE